SAAPFRARDGVGLPARRLPDGGGRRRGVRFPDPHRAPVQHAGDAAGGLPVRGLSEAGGAAEPAGADGGTAADPHVLAAVGSGGGKADFGKGKGGGIGPLRTCFRRSPPDLLSPSSPDLIRGSEARG